jgi:hypothetical protein
MSNSSLDYRITLYILVVTLFVFSLEFPLNSLASVTKAASINTEDFAVVLLLGVIIADCARTGDWSIRLTLPRLTMLVLVISGWIMVTIIISSFRSEHAITPSLLWTLKWFEVVVFFILLQHHMDREHGYVVLRAINICGLILATVAVVLTLFGHDRIRIFFDNPNVLSVLFNLILIMNLSRLIISRDLWSILLYSGTTVLSAIGLLTTISRSGLLGAIVGSVILLILMRKEFMRWHLAVGVLASVGAVVSAASVLGQRGIERLTEWITFRNGVPMLADTPAAVSFEIRLRRIQYAIDLFIDQPLFGYGWYAAPSRVGYIDVYYATLAVELGIVGIALFTLFHLGVLRRWFYARSHGAFVIGSAIVSWHSGLLAQAVGGSFPRIPHILFLTLLVLVGVWAAAMED